MSDVFGNYVIQKLFEFGGNTVRVGLCDIMVGRIMVLSMGMYGCRVVQKALEFAETFYQQSIVRFIHFILIQFTYIPFI